MTEEALEEERTKAALIPQSPLFGSLNPY
jgi:hypothetical protein